MIRIHTLLGTEEDWIYDIPSLSVLHMDKDKNFDHIHWYLAKRESGHFLIRAAEGIVEAVIEKNNFREAVEEFNKHTVPDEGDVFQEGAACWDCAKIKRTSMGCPGHGVQCIEGRTAPETDLSCIDYQARNLLVHQWPRILKMIDEAKRETLENEKTERTRHEFYRDLKTLFTMAIKEIDKAANHVHEWSGERGYCVTCGMERYNWIGKETIE